jgi:hypothetical protein
MYELDTYLEAQEDFPDVLLELEVEQGIAYPVKKDLLKRIIYYSYEESKSGKMIPVSLDRVKEIIQLNKKGIQPHLTPSNADVAELDFMSAQTELRKLPVNKKRKRKKNTKPNKLKNSRKGIPNK